MDTASKYRDRLSTPHLLSVREVPQEDIALIFAFADKFNEVLERPIRRVPTLQNISVANLFFENSTRTRLSFELAAKRLSAEIINFSAGTSSLQKGESLIDTVNTIISMKMDVVIVRHQNPGVAHFLAGKVDAAVINAGDGAHEHPTQALLDAYTIRQKLGRIQGRKITILGDVLHSRVALSNIHAFQKLGAHVAVCAPKTLLPKHIETLGVEVHTRLQESLVWCDVIYLLRVQHERHFVSHFPSDREYHHLYGLTVEKLKGLPKLPLIMHPGPVNRGVEVSSEVLDMPNAVVLDQVQNGVAIRMAVLYLLSAGVGRDKTVW